MPGSIDDDDNEINGKICKQKDGINAREYGIMN